jgi:S1-C subfamily serine protease
MVRQGGGATIWGGGSVGNLACMTPSGVGDDGAPHDEDDGSWRRPPPPDDRLWRHPSELALPEVRRLGRPALSVLAGLLVGAALATAGVVLVGGRSEPAADATANGGAHGSGSHTASGGLSVVPTASTLGTATVGPLVTATVERVSGATVRVAVERGGTTQWGTAFSDGSEDLVVTSRSLVRDASALSVVMHGGTHAVATLVGADAMSGVAVLRCDGQLLPAAPVSASPPRTGDMVLTLTDGSMAVGVVTAVGVDTRDSDGDPVLDAIATDLPAGSAALGAPVLDSHGDVVGMIVSSGAGRQTLAAPVASVRAAAAQLASSGTVAHGWLGVEEATATPVGLAIGSVDAHSPAAGGAITAGDLIVAVDGRQVRTMEDLQAAVALRSPGQTVSVALQRAARQWTVRVVLARLASS